MACSDRDGLHPSTADPSVVLLASPSICRCFCRCLGGLHHNGELLPSPGGGAASEAPACIGVEALVSQLAEHIPSRPRPVDGPFRFAVDHCFAIRGQGTVLTGTVLQVGSPSNLGMADGQHTPCLGLLSPLRRHRLSVHLSVIPVNIQDRAQVLPRMRCTWQGVHGAIVRNNLPASK
jgi:hypothetical protein